MKSTSPLRGVFEKLRTLGLSEAYVRERALPMWWSTDDLIAATPLGMAQALGYLSTLGLDVASLVGSGPARFTQRRVEWKTPRNVKHGALEVVKGLAAQAAELALSAAPAPRRPLATTALQWRARLIQSGGIVSFESLLEECWTCGIPVLSIAKDALPRGAKRPHGLAVHCEDGFAIVLTGSETHTAWQLFRLAHEVGHIARGHLRDEEVLVDADVWKNEPDAREEEANTFASELIFGSSLQLVTQEDGAWLSADDLLFNARRDTDRYKAEPGALILNWARHMSASGCGQNCWATAQAALKSIADDDAHEMMRRKLGQRLDWEELSEQQTAFVRGLTRLLTPNALAKDEVVEAALTL